MGEIRLYAESLANRVFPAIVMFAKWNVVRSTRSKVLFAQGKLRGPALSLVFKPHQWPVWGPPGGLFGETRTTGNQEAKSSRISNTEQGIVSWTEPALSVVEWAQSSD